MKKSCLLNLDRKTSIEVYSRSSTEVWHKLFLLRLKKLELLDLIFGPSWNICLGFLFSQPQTYIRLILKGRRGFRKCPNSLFSVKKLLCFYAKGFVTKELPDLHFWWSEELCSQHLLQVGGVSHILGSMHHWLVTYWDSCIERKDCCYNTSPIRY